MNARNKEKKSLKRIPKPEYFVPYFHWSQLACMRSEQSKITKPVLQPIGLDGRGPRQRRRFSIGWEAEINRGLARAMIKRYSLSCQRMICRGDLYGAWRNCLMHLLHCFQERTGDHFRYALGRKKWRGRSLPCPLSFVLFYLLWLAVGEGGIKAWID